MSPFMQADKIKVRARHVLCPPSICVRARADRGNSQRCAQKPLLMIHGQDDPNSGTYPMQSERMFNALRGHGASLRKNRLAGWSVAVRWSCCSPAETAAVLHPAGVECKLVLLPHEAHHYRARESILHTLAEQDEWMHKYINTEDNAS
eukprot:scaffold587_cov339-Prasinococcus_capsulatus_cf.AAC.10